MKRNQTVSKPKLYIEELEKPIRAQWGEVTTLAYGEEMEGKVTSFALAEEAIKFKV